MIGSPDDSTTSNTIFGMLKDIVSKINTIITTLATQSTQLSELSTQMTNMDAKIQNVYVATASTSFSSSQVRSTVVESIAPSEVLVKWDCTKDNRCIANSEFPERIDDTVITGFNIYYSDKNAAVKNMVYVDTVPYNDGILYTEDYEFVVDGLRPDTTYYIWVSANVGDAENPVVLNDNSYVRVIKTLTLESAKVTNVSAQPDNIDTIGISWQQPLASETVKSYNVYWSETELTKENISLCPTYKNTLSCSVTVSGLDATIYYYIAIVPVMRDDSVGLNIAATDISRASLELSKNGGRLVPVDLDNDGVNEAMLCTLTFGNTGQIRGQTQATLDSLVTSYFTRTTSDYYSSVLYKLIKEDSLTLHLLTPSQIDSFLVPSDPIEFVGENLTAGTAPNLAYSDSTGTSYSYYNGVYCSTCNASSWTYYNGQQSFFNCGSWTMGTCNWNGRYGCRHSYDGPYTPTVRVGLAGYFLISDMQR